MEYASGFGQEQYDLRIEPNGCAYFRGQSPMLVGTFIGIMGVGATASEILVPSVSETPPVQRMIDGGYLHIRIERGSSVVDLYNFNQTNDSLKASIDGIAFNAHWLQVAGGGQGRQSVWATSIRNDCGYLAKAYGGNTGRP